MALPDESLVGRTIAGKFAIEALLGSGAMGKVYRARQVALEKTVAVKVLHADLARDETFAARFHREARAASRLDHPNSMRVIDFGAEPDGMLYIAMEYLHGRDLLQLLDDDAPLHPGRIADLLSQALAALVVAHDMGVVHRDLKPENIMVLDATDDEGRLTDQVKVCDFGIAKISGRKLAGEAPESARGPITTAGLVVGTPEYMSPEQGRGDPLDARSDLYSIGVVLFQLLTGRVPFEAESALGVVFKQVNESPPLPSSINPKVDSQLEAICLRALRKSPHERYQSAREMRAALRAIANREGGRVSSSRTGDPRSSDRTLEHAETVSFPNIGSPHARARGLGDGSAHGTQSGTTALPALPVTRPSGFFVGVVALLVGAGATVLVARARAGPAAEEPVGLVASGGPASPVSAPVASAAGATPGSSGSPVASAHNTHATPGASPHASASARASTPALTPASTLAARSPSPVGPVAAAPVPTDAGSAPPFSLVTSSASPTVTKAIGVSAQDVRAALPSWKFTECYRDALDHANKPLEGHVTLSLVLDGSGKVTRVNAVGAMSLLSSTGSCLTDALSQLQVSHASTGGATADVDIACIPR